jgi:hypothetical protein
VTATGLDRTERDGFDHPHPPGRIGVFDESARRLSHEELAVAKLLVAEGHDVRAVAISYRATPDLEVCGRPTEVKTLGRGATGATVTNALRRARHQGADVIVDARGSGLQRLAAEQGVAAFATRRDRGLIERIRVLGAGFDRRYREADLDRMARRHDGPRLELR